MIRLWATALLALPTMASADDLPGGFVRLSDTAPHIRQDIRYARDFNFTSGPVPGYAAAECILSAPTAAALARVEARLTKDGYGLIVFDCYRPTRAVEFFADWAEAAPETPPDTIPAGDTPPDGAEPGAIFFPALRRDELFAKGFIARTSGHSLGTTVDVGLRRADDPPLRPGFADAGRCDAPFDARIRESSLDLGTAFDCFSPLSAIGAKVSPEATANRARLTAAMQAEGFKGYAKEWWHFRQTKDAAKTPQDFPVR